MNDSTPTRKHELLGSIGRFLRLWGFLLFPVVLAIIFREVMVPFVFAFALAYLMAPVINRMQVRLGRVLSVILVYLSLFGLMTAFLTLFLPALVADFSRLRDTAPAAIEYLDQNVLPQASRWVDGSLGTLHQLDEAVTTGPMEPPKPSELLAKPNRDGSWSISLEGARLHVADAGDGRYTIAAPSSTEEKKLTDTLRKLVVSKGTEYTGQIAGFLRSLVSGVTTFLTNFTITLMLAAFILVNPQRVTGFVRAMVPIQHRRTYDEIMGLLDVGLAGVIRGQLLICLVNGVLTYIGLVIFDIKYSFLLAVVAAAFSLVPIFGTIISSIPILLVALVSNENGLSFGPPLLMLAWIAGIHLLEANVFNPKIIGDAAHMHPVVVIFALLAGEHVYGLTGALLAAPVASMLQTLFLFAFRRSRWHHGPSTSGDVVPAMQSVTTSVEASRVAADSGSFVAADSDASDRFTGP
ncbi:AI-2E family transporter [Nannocystis bainbridge]|uniref:AI-2E family transporter n=1 Tax=Nannocystis bainbridge TaxID=2995303 RepID=A0ABT5EAR1_9BACT|nr:AI-2E family transporter [Nannocystis bainbridge]MDC0722937.1 AI-2E family transporter [Nannocystis bainbridge]